MGENQKNNQYLLKWLVVVIILIIYVLTRRFFREAFQRIREQEIKQERLHFLNHRKRKLIYLLQKKKHIQAWRDWIFRVVYPIVRVVLLLLWVFVNYCAKFYFERTPDLNDYLSWNAGILMSISALSYLFYGKLFNLLPTTQQIKQSIEKICYGRYIGIEEIIKTHEIELKAVEIEIITINKTLI